MKAKNEVESVEQMYMYGLTLVVVLVVKVSHTLLIQLLCLKQKKRALKFSPSKWWYISTIRTSIITILLELSTQL